jgi:hypothetical protein
MTWNGEPEAINRIVLGISSNLNKVLLEAGLEPKKVDEVINIARKRLTIPMVTPAMPIQDAIDLSSFVVDTTIQFSRFHPGAATVGGPIEIAVITKHEGFKWIRRKHYFDVDLNPKLGE